MEYLLGIFHQISMEAISLKLPEELLKQSSRFARALGIPRAEYIRCALEKMNREAEAQTRAKRLAEASRKVRRESMRVNRDFARIEREPDG
jgi:metal-responsive CopG/Arc/MetJ family transcriptional regulator